MSDEQNNLRGAPFSALEGAVSLLPSAMRASFTELDPRAAAGAEEIRLRAGYPPTVFASGSESECGTAPVTQNDLGTVMEIVTGASIHSVRETLSHGFVSAAGGYRIGVCGSLVRRESGYSYSSYSSLAIRIPRAMIGIADSIIEKIAGKSVLIISPPGGGKTTLLRDAVRLLSDGVSSLRIPPQRVALIDERSEVASMRRGIAQLYVGRHTDVIEGAKKADALMIATKVMNPQVAALDEITAPEDVAAVESACLTGVRIIATAHAASRDELRRKPLFHSLLSLRVFERLLIIKKDGVRRRFDVHDMENIGNAS